MADLEIVMDEFGRFWVAQDDITISGPYDTIEGAKDSYPEAEFYGG